MRTKILAHRMCALSKAASVFAIVSLAAGCSNDAIRMNMDTMTTASVANSPNQQRIAANQPPRLSGYGEEFDTNNSGVYVAQRDTRYTPVRVNPPPSSTEVQRASLPPATPPRYQPMPQTQTVAQAPTSNGPIVLQPRRTSQVPLRVSQSDQLTTSSVSPTGGSSSGAPVLQPATTPVVQAPASPKPLPVATSQPRPAQPVGWHSAQGNWVTVKQGETLYNLSRRYGVPVSAIMRANNMSDGNSVEAGKNILIPTYNYSNAAPVSAPDNDPITKASRATTGFQGQATGRIAIPTPRGTPPVVAAEAPLVQPAAPNIQPTSDQIATLSGSVYEVKPGDTLSGIAYRTGQPVSAIRQANGMTDDTVRLGQKLRIPGATSAPQQGSGMVLTGSIPKPTRKPARVETVRPSTPTTNVALNKPTSTATDVQSTSSSSFRWPAHGRVISKFGERSASGTNDGIDISMPMGTPVKASQAGTVIYAGSELEDFGNLILVSHAGGWVTAYAHSSANLVRRGEQVAKGQIIAKSGRSGNAKVPKLHFELRKDSNPVNPLKHLAN